MQKLITIRTIPDFNKLFDYLADKEFVASDIETDGTGKDSRIIGCSVCAEPGVGYYVVFMEWLPAFNQFKCLETLSLAVKFFALLKAKKLIMHNGVFDCSMVENNFRVELINSLHTDTMILAHLLDENRRCGLKELSISIFGKHAGDEQKEVKANVIKNGGVLTKAAYELYKADSEVLAKYGAKDAILTLNLFYVFAEQLIEQGLDSFFYEDECMPLLKGPTYQLNTVGLKVDPTKLQDLRNSLEVQCAEAKAYVDKEVQALVKAEYPGTSKKTCFNIDSPQQLSWLLFVKLANNFGTLTAVGKDVCKSLDLPLPYAIRDKAAFIKMVASKKGDTWEPARFNPKTGKMGRPKLIADPWVYMTCGKETLTALADKYNWLKVFLTYKKNLKLLNTYVLGIQGKAQYSIIHPSFLQHGTTSGRYSSRTPNFQNLPREDKRVKSCIVARPGKVFVGADYSQLEPRVFASLSQDEILMACFESGQDFYSVVGAPVFNVPAIISLYKDDANSFAKLYPSLRDKAKVLALATPYGRTAAFQAIALGIERAEAQEMIDDYFMAYPKVKQMMLESHETAKRDGVVHNLFGRPRRIPEAKQIPEIYGKSRHEELPYQARTLLNLAMNHRVQSTAASIVNRAMIRLNNLLQSHLISANIVLQVHDSIVVECCTTDAEKVSELLRDAMENTVRLPGVKLEAIPKTGLSLSEV